MSADANMEPPVVGPSGSGGSYIAEDLYCLSCGYNLRGLRGDPVRCPECGDLNDVATVGIPGPFIRRALAEMETRPTRCTGIAFFAVYIAPLTLLGRGRSAVLAALLTLACIVAWFASARGVAQEYQQRAGWKGIVWRFHLALFLCTSAIPIFIGLVVLFSDSRFVTEWSIWPIALLLSVPLFIIGLGVYRRAQADMAEMQRNRAIQIARDMLRRALHAQRRR